MSKDIVLKIVSGVIIAVIAFWGGNAYAAHKASANKTTKVSSFGQQGGRNGGSSGMGMGGRQNGGGFTTGEVLSKDDTSVTIKLRDGGSQIVFLGGTTTVAKSVEGSLNDLSVGENVMITGSKNSDGSLTAQSVQIRPAMGNK